ncbi:MAG: hypothetical protein HYX72_01390 [Acidobacteria bacterium]|nr:hypothetical protein [Acidobacteriota bacterium]
MTRFNTAILGSLILVLATGALAQNADLSGTWRAKTTSAQGSAEQTITFKQTGNSFTGEMITSQGSKEVIKDGKVDGDQIEFTVERKRPTGETADVPYKGKINGDEVSGTFTGATGRSVEWTAKREGK